MILGHVFVVVAVLAAAYAVYRAVKARKASGPLPAPQPGATVTPIKPQYPPHAEKP